MISIRIAILLIFLFNLSFSFAQTGCTDYQANNYDPLAIDNDGTCSYPFTTLPLNFKCYIDSLNLNETSGIINQDFNFWTHVDDTDNGIYRIDTLSDSIYQRVAINNATNIDWEDITTDSLHIYIGDVGNNDGNRTNLRFYKVLKSDITPSTTSVNAGIINFTYADQVDFTVNHNQNFYDCEAFVYMDDSIHIFTKGWVNRWTKHYILPAQAGTQVAQLKDSFNVNCLITSAAIQGDTLVVLVGLNFTGPNNCCVWMLSQFDGSKYFSGNKRRFSIGNFLSAGQAEAICFTGANRGYITNEGTSFKNAQIREFNLSSFFTSPPPAPILTTSVNSLSINLRACSDSGTSSLTISNSTSALGRYLSFSINDLPVWLSSTGLSDSIAPGDSAIISFEFISGMLAGGIYIDSFSLHSNDPQQLLQYLTCTLHVDSNPCMDFTYISDSCSGIISFHSFSVNTPVNYYWNFGDGNTSTAGNPVHSFTSNGNYITTLIGCNSAGCDTVIQPVQVNILSPTQSINCYPATQVYCCGRGITHVHLSGPNGDVINNFSSDAIAGYENFTCGDTGIMITNYSYAFTCTTGITDSEFLKVWLDMNYDGLLDSVSELLYSGFNTIPSVHSGIITIPALPNNVYGIPLRLRIASDYQNEPQPCLDPVTGQHEDYSIILNFSVDVNNLINETALNIYPNPFTSFANINYILSKPSKVTMEVFNVYGEKINMLVNSQVQLPGNYQYQFPENLPGIYFLKFLADQSNVVLKIVRAK